MIPMSLAEIVDRYTICKLKDERTDEDMSEELDLYDNEIENKHGDYTEYINQLYKINGEIWSLESDIRKGRENEIGLEEVGRRAIEIRNKNRERVAIKNKIIELTGEGYKDIKVNHGSD